ncbi:hypothetical protein [Clostridium botulinum]|uniref:hypothetical protein n=1 Tax=Clostridium botulinum TaxID=1491 RepID=UPI001C9AF890|nr:hypothetical protein [Clostridium botulinum]MBY6860782.1 hypothetical protein [Clostridium botulinum]MBY7043829.1 hypothetical protein [Clostridium botulinum]
MKRGHDEMNITANEIIECGKVLMVWGGSIVLIGATLTVIGTIYKDFFSTIITGILNKL